jgi:hypothetical protein
MDDRKFSKEQFDKCGVDSEAALMLADLLQQEVGQEIHKVVLPALEHIVQGLNREGHNLTPSEAKVGNLSYMDVSPDGKVRLRLHCDVVISSGYAHMYSDDKTPEEIITDVVERLREAMKNTGEES